MEFTFCVILSLIQVGRSLTDCPSSVYRDVQGFGPECRYRCNCINQHCNNVTGQCRDGCKSGWMGPSCQYRNIANLIMSTRQYPTALVGATSEYPGVAIDGSIATCSRTGPDGNQPGKKYWHADLREQTYVVGFVIKINQTDGGHFRGFSINVGSTTDTLMKCYRQGDNSDGELIMEVNCEQPVVGNIIRISLAENETNALALCEVEIYGGRLVSFHKPTYMSSTLEFVGFWNSSYAVDGRSPLPVENQDANATIRTCASTMDDDTDMWWIVNLNSVYSIIAVNFYGRFTFVEQFNNFIVKAGLENKIIFTDSYSTNVHNYQPRSKNLIWPVDGEIVRVERMSNVSWKILVICELEIFADCPYGLCGWECNERCMCKSQTTGTNKILGTCPHGCAGRWTGLDNKCNIECLPGKWGPYCNNTCSGDCGADCDAATGFCPVSCQPGWKPPQCNKECSDGTYGINCTSTCGSCIDMSQCNKTSGQCASGCRPGYKQPRCIDACDFGNYGPNCVSVCGACDVVTNCHIETGKCSNGCLPGRLGIFCKDPCPEGYFGQSCYLECGHCKDNKPCEPQTGHCELCAEGYTGEYCKTICPEGRYGEGCVHSCGHCADRAPCNKTTGVCPMGCILEYTGSRCIEATSFQTSLSAGAVVGIVVGVIVVIATVIIIIAIFYKRRTPNKDADNTYTRPSVTATRSDNDVYDIIVNNT